MINKTSITNLTSTKISRLSAGELNPTLKSQTVNPQKNFSLNRFYIKNIENIRKFTDKALIKTMFNFQW